MTQEYPKHYCGVFGIYGHPKAAELTYYGLYALQHRGQESAGIVTSDGNQFRVHKGMGLVPQIFDGDVLNGLVGGAGGAVWADKDATTAAMKNPVMRTRGRQIKGCIFSSGEGFLRADPKRKRPAIKIFIPRRTQA